MPTLYLTTDHWSKFEFFLFFALIPPTHPGCAHESARLTTGMPQCDCGDDGEGGGGPQLQAAAVGGLGERPLPSFIHPSRPPACLRFVLPRRPVGRGGVGLGKGMQEMSLSLPLSSLSLLPSSSSSSSLPRFP